jgi:paired amphipathic helix protein Sin3a
MEYVQRIKQRLPPELYQEFLDILDMYKRPQPSEVSGPQAQFSMRIARLFQDAPDLLSEFQSFAPMLPNADMFSGEVGMIERDDRLVRGAKRKAADTPLLSSTAAVGGSQKKRKRPTEREKEREREREREREEREREREMRLSQNKV